MYFPKATLNNSKCFKAHQGVGAGCPQDRHKVAAPKLCFQDTEEQLVLTLRPCLGAHSNGFSKCPMSCAYSAQGHSRTHPSGG